MTFGIIATPGAADANSYVTEAEATDYIAEMILNSDVQHWGSGNEDSRHRALAAATQRLDRERFLGARVTNTQALQWPRTGVRRPDTYINTYSVGFPFRITTDYFTDTEIPEQIKRAQVELAVYLHQNVEGLGLSGSKTTRTSRSAALTLPRISLVRLVLIVSRQWLSVI